MAVLKVSYYNIQMVQIFEEIKMAVERALKVEVLKKLKFQFKFIKPKVLL